MAEWKMLCLPSVLLLWPQIFSTTLQDNGHPGSGCLTTTDTKVHMKYLRSYKLQHKPLYPVDAVRFLTIKGNTICLDPFQLDGLAWEEEKPTTMNEPFIDKFYVPIPTSCLTTTDTEVPLNNLRSYTLQHKPLFPVDAVRFLTIKGNTICLDPSSPWAVNSMKYLDAKKKPQSASARQSVTAAPKKMSTINTKSAPR
uniref:Chemokine ligand 32a n=1 Tax=Ctenopharyngodon idella TaxID=7959 RepID=A0A345D744_CTEID|nr:chemokine ligand 32a [Ctenopharyngodon idella]